MADGSEFFGGSGSEAAGGTFGGAGFSSDPVLTGASDALAGETFSYGGPGVDYATLVKVLAAAAGQLNQQPQQAGYQNMVPPQSMTMRPPGGMITNMPRGSMPNQNQGLDAGTMQRLAAKKLAEEQADAGIGGALGTLAGGLAGFALGGPTGAAIGASAGGGLGKAIS